MVHDTPATARGSGAPPTPARAAVTRLPRGPLPPPTVLALSAGLAEGLIAIHAAGVIHRDLKPSNVLLAQDGPRIIDFGISSAAGATALTGTGFMIGSPGFMSPEQAEGLTVGPSSDIFSLIMAGKLHLRIQHVYKLEEAQQAHRDLEARKTTGKILLSP